MKNVIIKFKKEAGSANGTEELQQLKNKALHECKKIAKTQLEDNMKKYDAIKAAQEEKSKRRIDEEKRWLKQNLDSIDELQKSDACKIEDKQQESMLEIARICDQRYKELKGGNNE